MNRPEAQKDTKELLAAHRAILRELDPLLQQRQEQAEKIRRAVKELDARGVFAGYLERCLVSGEEHPERCEGLTALLAEIYLYSHLDAALSREKDLPALRPKIVASMLELAPAGSSVLRLAVSTKPGSRSAAALRFLSGLLQSGLADQVKAAAAEIRAIPRPAASRLLESFAKEPAAYRRILEGLLGEDAFAPRVCGYAALGAVRAHDENRRQMAEAQKLIRAGRDRVLKAAAAVRTSGMPAVMDRRLPGAPALIAALYACRQRADAARLIDSLGQSYGARISSAADTLLHGGNGLNFVFSPRARRQKLIRCYAYLNDMKDSVYSRRLGELLAILQKKLHVTEAHLWADYEQHTAEYAALLNDIASGGTAP